MIINALLEASKRGKKIAVRWNMESPRPSQVILDFSDFKPSAISSIYEALIVEDGIYRGKPFYVPVGEVRVNLEKLIALGTKVSGRIIIQGEPIIGLKPPCETWLMSLPCKPVGELDIETKAGSPVIRVKDTKLQYLRDIDNAVLGELHIGLNPIRMPNSCGVISPILTRTLCFIHFWIIDRNNRLHYQLLVKNAEILLDDKVIWRTT